MKFIIHHKILVKKILSLYIGVLLLFSQSTLVYAQELATPSATPDMSSSPQATPSMVLDQLEASDSASPSAVVDIPTPSPTLEMLTGPSGVLTPSASFKGLPHIRQMTKHTFRAGEVASVVVDNISIATVKAIVRDSTGEAIDSTPSIETYDGGIRVIFTPKTSMQPGKYTIVVEDTTTGDTVTQDFLWGVLAFNTDQATYNPGDIADIALAVLDDTGMMVCDADVTLTILAPSGKTLTLSTADGSIRVTPACKLHDYTLTPDYETTLKTADEGVYQVLLSATTKNGTYSIQDSFQVSSDMPFGVKRTSATRIFPPEAYPMSIDVTANEDFSGVVTETVPENFTITPLDGSLPYADVKTIVPVMESQTPILLGMPFDGNYSVTLGFGDRIKDPQIKSLYEQNGLQGHDGADFAMQVGTVVLAADSGTVSRIADNPYGTTVVIDHSWGRSYYGHLSVVQVKEGDTVAKGAPIALSGNTGLTTGAHLHFGMKLTKNDVGNGYYGKTDPMPYLTSSVIYQAGGSGKQISWNVHIKTGEKIRLGYTYKAPEVSPQFYLVGPLTFRSSAGTAPAPAPVPGSPFVLGVATGNAKPSVSVSNNITYQEPRRWQIAADAVGVPKIGTLVEDATGNFDLIEPAGIAQGDLMIAAIAYRGNAAITLPANWALVATQQSSGDTDATNGIASGVMAYIVRGASAPSLTFTRTLGDVVQGRIIAYSGMAPSPYDTGTANTLAVASVTATTGTITTAEDGELIVAMVSGGDTYTVSAFDAATDPTTASGATNTTTAPTAGTWIERADNGTGTGADSTLAIADAVRATAGATGTIQATVSGSARQVMIAGAFKINTPPTVSLTTPTDGATCQSTTPALVFTGTDPNSDEIEYNVQVDTVNTFSSNSVGFNLKYVDLYLYKSSSPTDNLYIDILSTSITGTVLGTSNAVVASTITGTSFSTASYIRFTFATPISLSASTKYYLVFRRSSAYDSVNRPLWNQSTTSVYAGGGQYIKNSGSWSSESATNNFRLIIYDTNTIAYFTQDVQDGTFGQPLQGAVGADEQLGQSFTVSITSPLLDINSINNSGFSGTGDPHPWPSGNAVTYSVSQKTADSWVDASTGVMSLDTTKTKLGQSFTGDGGVLSSAGFYLNKSGSPTGNAVAKIYNMSGNWDTGDNIPTGSALAVSENFDVSTLTDTSQLTIFTFSGANKITLVNGTHYVVSIEWVAVGADVIRARLNIIGGTHAGNYSAYTTTTGLWQAPSPLADLFFSVYTDYALDAGTTYYWRVRAKDPLGSNTWGEWSPGDNAYGYNSFTAGSCGPTTDQQMRHGNWFSGGVEQSFTF